MPESVMVLGAGMVGVSVALHLRRRGCDVVLVDRQGPGEGASFGNGGLIQREAVYPHAFPRSFSELLRIARNNAVDVSYHPLALPGYASPLLRYWWHSEPARYEQVVLAWAALIRTCLDEHLALARGTEAMALLRPIGFMRLFRDPAGLEAAAAAAEIGKRDHDVNFAVLDGKALAAAEPHLLVERAGALHWTDPLSVSDPHALTLAYFQRFLEEGGSFATGDATTLAASGSGWKVQTQDGPIEAARTVVALGAWAPEGDAAAGLCAADLRQARLPLPLRHAGQCRAEPPDHRHRCRLRPDADARRRPAHQRCRVRRHRRRRDAGAARTGRTGGPEAPAAGGPRGGQALAGRAPLHAGHAAGHRAAAEA
jgi:glycine/D-amino acid oxidase-like deaminating enzyme